MNEKIIFQITEIDSIPILKVFELLSEYDNKEILEAAQQKINIGQTTFVVDMRNIPYVNSIGLNFLISLQNRSKEAGGQIAIANVSKKIMQLLEITKLEPLFQITDSVESAIRTVALN